MLKHFLNPPNWFTSASLFCGLYSVILSTGIEGEVNFYKAALMIFFAGIFDMLDGGVARFTGTGSRFGVELDSLSDVVSFGIAPAILLYAWAVHALGSFGLVVSFFFLLCGIFRLARFNSETTGSKPAHSKGLTITAAGGTVAAAVMAHSANGLTSVEHPVQVALLAVVLALFMVSNVPFRTLASLKLRRSSLLLVALNLAFVLVLARRYNLSTGFFGVCAAYMVLCPIEATLAMRRRTINRDD
jgi:CDP-diacylglycerol--serine O-phosphatidyltransferase